MLNKTTVWKHMFSVAVSAAIVFVMASLAIAAPDDAAMRKKYQDANTLLKRSKLTEAKKELLDIIQNYPDCVYTQKALQDIIYVYLQEGDYDEAGYCYKMLVDNFSVKSAPGDSGKATAVVKNAAPDSNVKETPETKKEAPAVADKPVQPAAPEVQRVPEQTAKPAAVLPSKPSAAANSAQDRDKKISELKSKYPMVGDDILQYTVQPGDSLLVIAKRFGTNVERVQELNGLISDVIRLGQKLKIDVAKYSVFVDKAQNTLVLKKNGAPIKTYKVSTGRNNSTPVGTFKIVDRMIKPPWTKPGVGIVMPESPDYELGERWMPIDKPGYGIHGTNDESTIGGQTTSGCVRMYNKDVVELFNIVPKGTEVEIVDGGSNGHSA
ncbi:MAG: L,D-transpeptidase family protein [Candidatus Omnitrophica bacterium]|nr:L,D-transpeptidase family protein [Candidatus Omnitrophota bacterium]